MTLFLGALFVVSLLLTVNLVPWISRLARRRGFLDIPGPRKIHTAPVPYGGGIAVAGGLLITAGLAFVWAPKWAFPAGAAERAPTIAVFALGSLVILALGLVDDRRGLSAAFKLLVQAIVAAGVALGGERLELFDRGQFLETLVTILWILAVTNAFNLLDHLDGLSAGVAAISGVAFLIVALQTGQIVLAAMLVPLLGACAGFLIFNFPPAKIFLGDAGSLFIGFWLACLTVSFTFYSEEARYPLYTYLVPLAVLAVPLFDTSSVVLIRMTRGRPIFEADTNHLAHRLVAMGLSRRRALLSVYVLTFYAGLSAVLLYHVNQTGAIIVLSQLLLTFGIITLLEISGRAHADA